MRKSHSPGHASAHFLRALILVSLLLGLLPAAAPGHARAQTCDDANCITANPNGADFAPYAMVASTLADDGRTVRIEWITEREIFSAGFNIVVETDRGFVPVNDRLIPSRVIESLDPQFYSYTTAVDADAFYLEHVTIENERFRAGPFFVGERVGEAPQTEAIDWRAIRAASEAKAQARAEKSVAAIDRALDAVRGPQESMGAARVTQVNGAIVNLLVKEEGIYRVRFEDIDNNGNGPDLRGVPIAYLALTNRGMPVRIHMVASGSSSTWEEGAYFEFVGEGIDTFYTDENIYVLQVNRSKAFRIFTNMRMPDLTETPAPYYRETIRFEENNTLALSSTGADPWAWQYRMARPGFPVLYSASLPGIDAVASNGPPPQLTTEIWGGNNLSHHAIFAVNGTQLQDINFTGEVAATTQSPMPAGILQNGGNSVTWTLPGDSSAFNDTMGLEAVTIEYSREFVTQDGALAFEGDAGLFRVDGLTSDQVTVFSRYRHRLWVTEAVITEATPQGYSAAFYGWGDSAEYFVAAEEAIKTPVIKVGQVPVDIESGTADFVIIAHPDFLSGLQPLVAARSTPEFTVKVVNVLDVYARYSDSIFDAQAIRDYIQHVIPAMGAEYILLVGGDVIDYRNYVYPDAVSFIPSLYAETYPGQNFMPVDPLYTDIDDDGTPDAAIGRFPVKTAQELAAMVSKTLDYTN
ncbi:MAG: hypothetical protein KDD92_18380 [Caldilineaceae bacterium]|nr:hypothetical protein [Caldilineaceae bacterium]